MKSPIIIASIPRRLFWHIIPVRIILIILVQPVSYNSNIDLGLGAFGFPSFPYSAQGSLYQTFDQISNNVQVQQYLRLSMLGQHSLIGGFDYFTGPGIDQRRFQNAITTIDTTALALFGSAAFA